MAPNSFLGWFDWAARADFAGNVVGWVWDWKGWVLSTIGGLIVGAIAKWMDGWSSAAILLAMLGAFVAVALIYLAFCLFWDRSDKRKATEPARLIDSAPLTQTLTPDITASDAYFKILDGSEWVQEQRRITTDTTHLRRDWVEFRLSKEIHTALRNARLESWGEECLHGMVTTPQKPIPPNTWDTVEIGFDRHPQFTRTSAYQKGETTYQHGRSAWVDVKFSTNQIFAMFPFAESTSPTSRDVTVGDAIAYLCLGKWGMSFTDAAGSGARNTETKLKDFLQAMADGRIPTWGRKESAHRVLEPIAKEFWFTNQIDWFSLLRGDAHSQPLAGKLSGGRYFSLMTSRTATESLK